jgi:trypsin
VPTPRGYQVWLEYPGYSKVANCLCTIAAVSLVRLNRALLVLLILLAAFQGVAAAAQPPLKRLELAPHNGLRIDPRGIGDRIVGGNPTDNSKYPWQAQVFVETDEGTFFCGGTLIHPFIVMTAAHCLVDGFGQFKEIFEVEVWLGRTELSGPGERHDVTTVWANSNYNPSVNVLQPNRNDVGFVTLETGSLRPRPLLAGPTERALWTPGRAALITGWGRTAEGGQLSPVLKEAQVPIVADATCTRPDIDGSRVDPGTMVCAGDLAGGTDPCQGDSGGPLLSPIDGGGYRVTGIVSWGFGCARPNRPGVFTRIAADPLESYAQASVSTIEREDEIPLPYTGISVIGSGARPPGCGVAEAGLAQANAGAAAAGALLGRRKGEDRRARQAVKSATSSLRAALRSKRHARGRSATRRAGRRAARAGKRLVTATSSSRRAKRRLARASAGSTQAAAALTAATANRSAVCG